MTWLGTDAEHVVGAEANAQALQEHDHATDVAEGETGGHSEPFTTEVTKEQRQMPMVPMQVIEFNLNLKVTQLEDLMKQSSGPASTRRSLTRWPRRDGHSLNRDGHSLGDGEVIAEDTCSVTAR